LNSQGKKTMLDIVAIGEAMFEFSQLPNSSGHWLEGFGGDTLNMLIAAQRAGARTGFLSALGDDEFGDSIFSLMTREAVDCQAVERSTCAPTGIYFIHHDHEGHRFSYRRKGSAASQMQANRWLHAPASRWLYASGISQAIGPGCRALVQEAFTNAQAGCQRAYDLNFRSKLWAAEQAYQALVELAPFIDVLLPSLDDVGALAEQPDISIEDALHWLDQFSIREVVLRCGAKGAVLIEQLGNSPPRLQAIPGHSVNAVDATGAGDCFNGNFLAARLRGLSLTEAAHEANQAAAQSTLTYGAIASFPYRSSPKP
jgi:2-dehydro-3-deoxygluconokinase